MIHAKGKLIFFNFNGESIGIEPQPYLWPPEV